ncbi:Hypothetical predicted protein [Podarcis lilfordi]|nr:Hypothetical predicted protein [Podarcis lilfordi]
MDLEKSQHEKEPACNFMVGSPLLCGGKSERDLGKHLTAQIESWFCLISTS